MFNKRSIYYYTSGGMFNPYTNPTPKSVMNFTYNKPYMQPYKAHSEIGMVGTISSSYRAKRKKI